MPKARFRLPLLRIASALLFLTTLLTGWQANTRLGAQFPAPEPVFGPELRLLTLAPETLTKLPAGLRLHARLGDGDRFIASVDAPALAWLTAQDIPSPLLDRPTGQEAYYLVDAQAPGALEASLALGTVLHQDEQLLLVRVERSQERALVEVLPSQGIPVSLLTPHTLALEESGLAVQEAGGTPAQEPDPFVASLLPQLTQADLEALIRQISGETPVELDGSQVTLNTRYTFSTRVRDAERFVYQYYANRGMAVSYFNWTYGNYSGRNVIAELPGTQHPERIWVIGGHLDDISDVPYSLAPGADDNATGTAATLLIAEILRAHQPADTIRFVHFTGEEQGQWGSKRYAAALKAAGEQIQGYIDLDMIGWDGDGDRVVELHTGTGSGSNALGTAFIDANQRYGQGLSLERKSSTASRFSDHSPFWDNGYPAFLAIENFFDDAIPRDRNPWYHTSGDRLERVDLDYVARYARTALATLAELAGVQQGSGTPVPTFTATATPSATVTPTPVPTECVELLANGNFEGSGGWGYGSTPYPAAISGDQAHGGSFSLRLGIPEPAANRLAHSSAFQQAAIPGDAVQVILRYWQRTGGTADGTDYREALLLDSGYGFLTRLERDGANGTESWAERVYDLTSFKGQTVTVYFNVYNDGAGSQLWNYVDDVSLLACSQVPETPTPTITPTVTVTTTVTGTPTPWGRLYLPHVSKGGSTATPTPTPTGNSTIPLPTDTPIPTPTTPE